MTSDAPLKRKVVPAPFAWRAACKTDVGKVRTLNEDAVLDRGDIGLWAVADGMGGHSAGDLASRKVVDSLQRLPTQETLADLIDAVDDSLWAANQWLFTHAEAKKIVCGCTIAALTLAGAHGVVIWAGDSRVYRLRSGQLLQLTTDHSQVEELVQSGQLLRHYAEMHPAANIVTRAVGVTPSLTLEMAAFELQHNDRFLVCSDGLNKHLQHSRIADLLISSRSCEEAVEWLVNATLDSGAHDNVTVCVVDVDRV